MPSDFAKVIANICKLPPDILTLEMRVNGVKNNRQG